MPERVPQLDWTSEQRLDVINDVRKQEKIGALAVAGTAANRNGDGPAAE